MTSRNKFLSKAISLAEANSASKQRRPTMLKKISLAFALATALAGALPAFAGMALAQGYSAQFGECTTTYYGHGPC